MKFKMVEESSHEQQEVAWCCKVLKVSPSGYYAWLKRPLSVKKTEDERLWQKIKNHWEKSRKTYGSPRITNRLQNEGEVCSKHRVAKIMKEKNIQGVGRKKFKIITTDSNHKLPIADRIFQTEEASVQVNSVNQYWGGDITYIPTDEGWLYLAVFLDLFTRKVVGYSMQSTMQTKLILDALDMGIKQQGFGSESELVVHSDRGSQYASEEYREKLNDLGMTASMSRKGNCYDNAFTETFFKTLKTELVYRRKFKTRNEAKAAIFEYIEVWYNRQRIHSSLDYKTPVGYETELINNAA
jgi:putative transposase